MNTVRFAAMGTQWWVRADVELGWVRARVAEVEESLSRFDPRSSLSRLNRERIVEDALLAGVVRAAESARAWTGGAFDARLGAQLAGLGYDRDFAAIRRPLVRPGSPSCLRVQVQGARVVLGGEGDLDLGGIAKGWTVDNVMSRLAEHGATHAIVDAGGDIRVLGEAVWVGVPGGAAPVGNAAIATSSTVGRAWLSREGRRLHHLLDPSTGNPATSPIATATVLAATALGAEVIAKALVVRPALCAHVEDWGARAWVTDARGAAWCTPSWEAA